jgi:hypothetical protein
MNGSKALIHDTLYLVDGNIVLVAHPTGTCVMFQVHQSILAKNYTVFTTMFTLPVATVVKMYDGVPLVQMPDEAEEIESLLQVLYHKW